DEDAIAVGGFFGGKSKCLRTPHKGARKVGQCEVAVLPDPAAAVGCTLVSKERGITAEAGETQRDFKQSENEQDSRDREEAAIEQAFRARERRPRSHGLSTGERARARNR